jgi:hypothetical protein
MAVCFGSEYEGGTRSKRSVKLPPDEMTYQKPIKAEDLGCLHSVVCVRSRDGSFYPSTQRQYRRLIY